MSQLASLFVDETTCEASLSHSQRYKVHCMLMCVGVRRRVWGMVFRVCARISLKRSSNFCCCYFFRSHLQYVGQIFVFFFFNWLPTKTLNEVRVEWTADAEDRFEPGGLQTGWTHSLGAEGKKEPLESQINKFINKRGVKSIKNWYLLLWTWMSECYIAFPCTYSANKMKDGVMWLFAYILYSVLMLLHCY